MHMSLVRIQSLCPCLQVCGVCVDQNICLTKLGVIFIGPSSGVDLILVVTT